MSVFSIRPDGPRTPTSRARGSIRSKQSSRTPSGSANNNNGSNENSSDKKRKRDDQGGASDSESSEVITPLSQSRSGRKIVQSTPVIKIAGDEVRSGGSPIKGGEKGSPAVRHGSVAKAVVVVEGKKKNRSGSKKTTPGGAAAVCKNCGRLHSPQSNAMVFCDGCNTGWHQHCHDPPISQDIVLIESKEWFCTDCVVLKEEKSRLHGKVSGQHMSLLDVSVSYLLDIYVMSEELTSRRNVGIYKHCHQRNWYPCFFMHALCIRNCQSSIPQRCKRQLKIYMMMRTIYHIQSLGMVWSCRLKRIICLYYWMMIRMSTVIVRLV